MKHTNRIALLIWTAFAALFATRSASAVTVTVSTEAQLRSAVRNATAGTTIILNDGTYNLTGPIYSTANGTSTLPITIKTAHANLAIINTNGSEEAFMIEHPYWRFQYLYVKVQGTGSYHAYKMQGNGSHCRVT